MNDGAKRTVVCVAPYLIYWKVYDAAGVSFIEKFRRSSLKLIRNLNMETTSTEIVIQISFGKCEMLLTQFLCNAEMRELLKVQSYPAKR